MCAGEKPTADPALTPGAGLCEILEDKEAGETLVCGWEKPGREEEVVSSFVMAFHFQQLFTEPLLCLKH